MMAVNDRLSAAAAADSWLDREPVVR
jgi:hypothetical protein